MNKYWLKTMSDDAEAFKLGIGQARRPLSAIAQARRPLFGIDQATTDFAGWGGVSR